MCICVEFGGLWAESVCIKLQMMQFQRGHTRHNFVSHTSREVISINNLEKKSKRIHS